MPRILACITYEHNLWIVLLAALICAGGCMFYVALSTQRSSSAGAGSSHTRMMVEAAILSHTAWTTHFVAMVGYQLSLSQSYEPVATAASAVLIAAATMAAIMFARGQPTTAGRLVAGGIFGVGVSGMHYLGMAGFQLPMQTHWDGGMVALSVIIAVAFAAPAFHLIGSNKSFRSRAIGCVLLVLSIAALHFTGMSAITLYSLPEQPDVIGSDREVLILCLFGLTLIIVTSGLTVYLRNGPRLIWRRNVVAMILLFIVAATSLFVNSNSRRHLEIYGRIGLLVSQSYADRAALDGVAAQYLTSPPEERAALYTPEIRAAHARLGKAADEIRTEVNDASASEHIRHAFLESTIGSDDAMTLFEDTHHYQQLYAPFFGPTANLKDLSNLRATGIASRYLSFGELVQAERDEISDRTQVEHFILMFGFLLVFTYQGVAIAIPGHRSVVRALDEVEQQKEKAEQLAIISERTTDGVIITNPKGVFVWVNSSFARMIGRSASDLLQMGLSDTLANAHYDRSRMESMLAKIGAGESLTVEAAFETANNSIIWTSLAVTPLLDGEGNIRQIIYSARDITEQRRLQEELQRHHDQLAELVEERTRTIQNQALELESALAAERELNQMQTEFVAMASHEFRTPLTIIDGVARRLDRRADHVSSEEVRERASVIRSTIKRMTMLVERTLDASRLSSGRMKLTPAPFAARQLVEDVCSRQRDVSPRHTIECDVSGYPEELFGDGRLLDNVFTNLLSNAVKYSPDNPLVHVRGYVEGRWARLCVRDHGVGIPAAELPRIFERFFRAKTSAGISGTGIGLNLVKALVDMHHGKVTLDSVEGEWTEIAVFLPLDSPLEQDSCEPAHLEPQQAYAV